MNSIHRRTLAVLALAAFFFFAATASVSAQEETEGQDENALLREQVRQLQEELDQARQEIEELRREIERLRQTTTGPATPPEEEKVSVDETLAGASPRALAAAITAHFEEAMSETDMGESADSRERRAYLIAVDRWSTRAEREFRQVVTWNVRVLEARERDSRTLALRLQAIDPQYGTRLGQPFIGYVDKSRAGSLEEHGMDATYEIRGTAVPRINVNPDLQSAEPFRESAFVGPFAELSLIVEILSIVQDDIGEEPADAPGAPGGNVDR